MINRIKDFFKSKGYLIAVCFSLGYLLHKSGLPNKVIQKIINSKDDKTYSRLHEADTIDFPKIRLHFAKKKWKKLLAQRELAMKEGPFYSQLDNFSGYQKGTLITNDNDTFIVKAKLKGLLSDHWADEEWMSLKLKLPSGKHFQRMNKFSIQAPKTRGYLNEWALHKILKEWGLIGLNYDFIEVQLNDYSPKIMAVEENMGKELIERNGYSFGPIFRVESPGMLDMPLQIFNSSTVYKDQVLLCQYELAEKLFNGFRNGIYAPAQVFDVEKMARLFAIIDLTGHHHACFLDNLKLYFNPVTQKIDPVAYDNQNILPLQKEGLIGYGKKIGAQIRYAPFLQFKNDKWCELLFKDEAFTAAYMRSLREVARPEWLFEFEKKYAGEMKQKLAIIHRSFPQYDFTELEIIKNNQKYIDSVLSAKPQFTVHAIKKQNNKYSFILISRSELPWKINSVSSDSDKTQLRFDTIIQGISPFELETTLDIPIQLNDIPKHFLVKAHLVGYENSEVSVLLKPQFEIINQSDWTFDKEDYVRVTGSGLDQANIKVDKAARKIMISSGIIKYPVIIPSDYLVEFQKGIHLDFSNSSFMISYSPLDITSSAEKPAKFYSSDSTGWTLFVSKTHQMSKISYAEFQNVKNIETYTWKVRGGITFYNSDVEFTHCIFMNNKHGDDMLNIAKSNFILKDCSFKNVLSDAFDGDAVNGTVESCIFEKTGNDGTDFSNSHVKIINCTFIKIGDKAVSCGEASSVYVENSEVKNSAIALTSKDLGDLTFKNITVKNTDVALCSFTKKPEFGASKITGTNLKTELVKQIYLQEPAAKILLDGKKITEGVFKDVQGMLYGKLYGKASVR